MEFAARAVGIDIDVRIEIGGWHAWTPAAVARMKRSEIQVWHKASSAAPRTALRSIRATLACPKMHAAGKSHGRRAKPGGDTPRGELHLLDRDLVCIDGQLLAMTQGHGVA